MTVWNGLIGAIGGECREGCYQSQETGEESHLSHYIMPKKGAEQRACCSAPPQRIRS